LPGAAPLERQEKEKNPATALKSGTKEAAAHTGTELPLLGPDAHEVEEEGVIPAD